jgi:hypothetical protein
LLREFVSRNQLEIAPKNGAPVEPHPLARKQDY